MIQSFHSRAIFEAMSYNFPTIFWSLILHISLTRLGYFSSKKGKLKFFDTKMWWTEESENSSFRYHYYVLPRDIYSDRQIFYAIL